MTEQEEITQVRARLHITCADAVELVTDLIEGALVDGDLERMNSHLNGCEACAVFVDQIASTVAIIGATRDDRFDLDADTMDTLLRGLRPR